MFHAEGRAQARSGKSTASSARRAWPRMPQQHLASSSEMTLLEPVARTGRDPDRKQRDNLLSMRTVWPRPRLRTRQARKATRAQGEAQAATGVGIAQRRPRPEKESWQRKPVRDCRRRVLARSCRCHGGDESGHPRPLTRLLHRTTMNPGLVSRAACSDKFRHDYTLG